MTKVLRIFSASDASAHVFTEAVDVGPTGVRSSSYWYVTERGVKLGRRFATLDCAKTYAAGRS